MNAKHLNYKPFACSENGCSFATTTKSGLRKHVETKHLKLRSHLCPHCGFGATTAQALENHLRKRHGPPRPKKAKVVIIGESLEDNLDLVRERAGL